MHVSTTIHKKELKRNQKKPTIEFWFEFASTYSYLSVERIENLSLNHGFQIIWKPFLLGPIFKELGMNDSPFNIYPIKGKYMWKDVQRICKLRNLPFNQPSIFPQNGLKAARIATLGANESWIGLFCKKVFRANFVENLDISNEEVLVKILNDMNLDTKNIIEQSNQTEIKEKLRENTDKAKELEIFGAPSFIVNNELYWGDDRLNLAFQLNQ
jgi:2-hydroxychromene-2-carboxylate isomerase